MMYATALPTYKVASKNETDPVTEAIKAAYRYVHFTKEYISSVNRCLEKAENSIVLREDDMGFCESDIAFTESCSTFTESCSAFDESGSSFIESCIAFTESCTGFNERRTAFNESRTVLYKSYTAPGVTRRCLDKVHVVFAINYAVFCKSHRSFLKKCFDFYTKENVDTETCTALGRCSKVFTNCFMEMMEFRRDFTDRYTTLTQKETV